MSNVLAGAGLVAAAGASAAAILLPPGRRRAVAMLLALALFPVLIVGDQWHNPLITDLRHHGARLVILGAVGAVVLGALRYVFSRWPLLLPLSIVFVLPFRVPLHGGGESANLLVPLYLVIAAGVLAAAARQWPLRRMATIGRTLPAGRAPDRRQDPPAGAPTWLPRILAVAVVLYAVQALYSTDFSKGLQNVCFFLVPFTIAYALLQDVRWDRRLLRWVLIVVGVEAAAFVLVSGVELATRSLFWNDQIIRSNEFHTYFRVNSVFWDPNVYGRYLALVTVTAAAAMLWARRREAFWLLCGLILVLWLGLVPTFSQSSLLALLAGLAMLAAVRWSWRWTLAAVAVGAVGAVLVVLLVGGSGKITPDRINVDLSGRGNLISGGADLFGERPIQGYGSGSFQAAYREHRSNKDLPVTVSHTEPITVAAEQGLIGLLAYLALIAVALGTLARGLWKDAPPAGPAGQAVGPAAVAARAAVLAAFVALLVHTLAYAGFFEDPITWVLLAAGAALAQGDAREEPMIRDPA
ncbi:MAG TPA: O-antigen ligase family protein [Solirubrobacterales bacterium]|nr:O-antigen ligase family protein [Solirubrobacterales bacterium]